MLRVFTAALVVFIVLPGAGANARVLEVSLVRAMASAGDSPEIRIVATGSQGGEARVVGHGFEPAELTVGKDVIWTVRAFADGYWSAPVTAVGNSEAVRVVLWPATRIVGSLSWPIGETAPEDLKVRFGPAHPEASRPPPGSEDPCHLGEKKERFVCEVPVGSYDLRFRAQGFVSLYFWDRVLQSGQDFDLGKLTLTPGSSVTGFVETEDSRPFDKSTQVELVPQMSGEGRENPALKLGRFAQKTGPNEKGFFHFAGVEEGLYSLRATQEGCSEAVVEGVDVVFGYETRLRDPLVLTPPRALQVQVTPRTDSRDEKWRLELILMRREKNAKVGEAAADDLGFATFSGLASGRYFVLVYENQSLRPFYSQELVLEHPSTFATLELPIVEVEGEVLLGDEPISATLLFGGSFSPESSEMRSDGEGRFRGFLAREGEWTVELEADEPMIRRSLRKVEIARKKGQAVARLTLRLPDLRFEGRVVNEVGQPAPKAMVLIRPEGEEHGKFAFRADEEGRFELFGMAEGRIFLYAGTKKMDSDEVAVDLVEDVEPPFVELVLRERMIVQGVVMSEQGPVPGASVGLRPWGSVTKNGSGSTTDARGNFEIPLPSDTKVVHVQVKAPGYGLLIDRREVDEKNPLVLGVDRFWGELDVLFSNDQERWVQVARGGGSVGFRSLLSWARLHSSESRLETGRALVPRLAPGTYSVCLDEPGSAGWLSLYTLGQSLPKARCVVVDLPPFGRETVDLADSDGQ